MRADVADWFAARSWQSPPWTVADLIEVKGETTVSVVLPALNEQHTVGGVVAAVLPLLGSIVDELLVVDSGSTDDTIDVARAAGARVIRRQDVLGEWEPLPGKGEVLWRGLAASTGDVVAFLDSDLIEPDPGFVTALLGPLLTTPEVLLVKGFYRRPLRLETSELDTGGGRVTELLARPLLGALRPELGGVLQPLGGEYAARRQLLESLPFAVGYGVEIGLLLDTHAAHGLSALAQVNLGVRKHRNRSLRQLGVMARQILGTALDRCGLQDDPATVADFVQFAQVAGEWLPDVAEVRLDDRPPLRELDAPGSQAAGCSAPGRPTCHDR